jgi:glycerol kinase
MSATDGTTNQAQTPEEIEAEIELKREQLAGTIDALATKLDVKSQAQAKVAGVKADARANPDLVAAGAAVVAMVVTALLLRSRG